MTHSHGVEINWRVLLVMVALAVGAAPREGSAQIGALVSPGRLSRAHASLEGITNCLSCHAAGRGVAADKCLTCHAPVAERIQQKKGVHRNVTNDCVTCHVEHAGVEAELRPFDQRRFNHATETGFPLDGLHRPLAANCASCHKGRSFLTAKVACASCHQDLHKGSLGAQCATCHTTAVAFKDTRTTFSHTRTEFPLTGSHVGVTCASCHKTPNVYANVAFTSCASCHTNPHSQRVTGPCASCHTTQAWRTTKLDHSKTAFPLKALHATVTCVKCHMQPAAQVKPASQTCATCHADPHRGSFKQDCSACHDESGFTKGAFDHSSTRFALADKHTGLTCATCHATAAVPATPIAAARPATVAGRGTPPLGRGAPPQPARVAASPSVRATDFRGLRTECVSCHTDVHEGDLGANCETCHTARTFERTAFVHAEHRPFFDGQHGTLRCEQCHVPSGGVTQPLVLTRVGGAPARAARMGPPRMAHVGLKATSATCVSCHRDVHAGQVGLQCETCHSLQVPSFTIAAFDHARTTFPLDGKHVPLMCEACHKIETGPFPAGQATARRLTGIGTACASCHSDPHDSQLTQGCQTCHSVQTFAVAKYTHVRARALSSFFVGEHATAECRACHTPRAALTPPRGARATVAAEPAPSRGTRLIASTARAPMSYRTSTACVSCHTDIHRGALGPRCESCHKP